MYPARETVPPPRQIAWRSSVPLPVAPQLTLEIRSHMGWERAPNVDASLPQIRKKPTSHRAVVPGDLRYIPLGLQVRLEAPHPSINTETLKRHSAPPWFSKVVHTKSDDIMRRKSRRKLRRDQLSRNSSA